MEMNQTARLFIIVGLFCAVGITVSLKRCPCCVTCPATNPDPNVSTSNGTFPFNNGLPTLVEIGSTVCTPCKMMKPVLQQLRENFQDQLNVVFFDVTEQPEQAGQFTFHLIPTQIFLDPNDVELYRHEGYCPYEDIVDQWKRLDFQLNPQTTEDPYADSVRLPH